MAKTWGDIKHEVLGLFNARSKRGVVYDYSEPSIASFVNEMPDAFNYAAKDLATSAAPIIQTYSVSQSPLANLISGRMDAEAHTTEDLTYSATDPRAYYFECDGVGTCFLEKLTDGVWSNYATISLNGARAYKAYKGIITGAGDYRLRFTGSYAYSVKNVAMYKVVYSLSTDDIPAFGPYMRYDLDALTRVNSVRRFYKLAADGLRFKGGSSQNAQYRIENDFFFEGDSVLYVKHDLKGQFDILYHAYPIEVTAATADAFAPSLAAEALDIIPYCMAGRIFLTADPQFAGYMTNLYMTRRAELHAAKPQTMQQKFYSESGWI